MNQERTISPHGFACGRTRREFLWQSGNGFFGTALTYMLAKDGLLAADAPRRGKSATSDSTRPPHHRPRAKSCIFLFMVGGPSHMDTFDPKPELNKRHGQEHSFASVASTAMSQKVKGKLKGAPWKFTNYGDGGIQISELFPHLSKRADELAVIRSTHADSSAHGSASLQMNTGYVRQGFPCLGSWSTYGLGTENANMPGFVVLVNGAPYAGAQNWSSGFMPSAYQGTVFHGSGDPVRNLRPSRGFSQGEQLRQLDLLSQLNEWHRAGDQTNSELAARIASYELAYRMQSHAPEAIDIGTETQSTKELYGIGQGRTDRFGKNCLLARRLVERGVRFVEIFHSNWDTHGGNDKRHRDLCGQTDKPIAGLLTDLAQRGLLEDTLVVWAGEFGRTPLGGDGRDHHASGFTTWLAGGGVRGGVAHGATDELGFHAVENRVHVHDLHATILHLMGLDHEQLTYRHNGRDFRLTDVAGRVVDGILS